MECHVIACDFDGTGASGGSLAPEVAAALHAARARGIATMLVTGRVLEDLRLALVDFSAFDAVIAENGAVVWFPQDDQFLQLAPSPPAAFLGRLRERDIPFHVGAVVIGTWEGHAADALALVRECGLDLQLAFNRGAVMLLPSGVNKATGVLRALAELRLSARDMVAFGDAENDLPLFALAEVAVAARGAVPAVASAADEQLHLPPTDGVAHYVSHLLDRGGDVPTPERHAIPLGTGADGRIAALPASAGNVLVSGDPRSGKSWLGGLLAEGMLEAGYRLCIVDAEGDHLSLAGRPGVLALGARLALPDADDVPGILRESGGSLVLSLVALSPAEKRTYACRLLGALAAERRRSGLPHRVFIDEAHEFLREGDECCNEIVARTRHAVLLTYRPSLLATRVHDAIDVHLLTHTGVDAERYAMSRLLAARAPGEDAPHDLLAQVHDHRAGLLWQGPGGVHWEVFEPAPRRSAHTHHSRKYVDTELPAERAFRFTMGDARTVAVAHNLREFAEAIDRVPIECLERHLRGHDFSRWAHDVLGDERLAEGFAKLEATAAFGATPDREEILGQIAGHYAL